MKRSGLIGTTATVPHLTMAELCAHHGVHRATGYRLVNTGYWPAPVYVGPRSPRWTLAQVDAHLADKRMLPAEALAARRAAGFATITKAA